jgi:hypothetical protein
VKLLTWISPYMDSSVTNTKAISIHAAARSEPREDEIMRIVNKLWNAIVALTNYGAKVQVNLTVGQPPATSQQLAFCYNRRFSLLLYRFLWQV